MTLTEALIAAVVAEAGAIALIWRELLTVQGTRAKERAAEAARYERLVRDVLDRGDAP